MVENLIDSEPAGGVDFETSAHEVVDAATEWYFGARDATCLGRFGVGEGTLASDEYAQQNSKRPHFALRWLVRLTAKNLARGE